MNPKGVLYSIFFIVYISIKLFVYVLCLYYSVGTASASKKLDLMPDPTPRLSTGVNYSWSKNKLSLSQKDSNQLSGYFDWLIQFDGFFFFFG